MKAFIKVIEAIFVSLASVVGAVLGAIAALFLAAFRLFTLAFIGFWVGILRIIKSL